MTWQIIMLITLSSINDHLYKHLSKSLCMETDTIVNNFHSLLSNFSRSGETFDREGGAVTQPEHTQEGVPGINSQKLPDTNIIISSRIIFIFNIYMCVPCGDLFLL